MENNKKDFNMLNKMRRLPEGLVIIPLVLAVIIAAFFPQVFQIGGYATALFYDGNSAMMGLFLIVCGFVINVRQVGMPLYRGVTLAGIRLLLRVAVGLLVEKLCGPADILGLTPFVLIAAITNSNDSLYIPLSSQFGNVTDTGAISILSLNGGLFFTLVVLGAAGLVSIPFKVLVATLTPPLIGFIWGGMDKDFRSACATTWPIVTSLMTISIDSKTDVSTLVTTDASGIVLGLISTAMAVAFFFVLDLLPPKKERNATDTAMSTTALNPTMTPVVVAQADPSMKPYVDMVTTQCATTSIIALFLCPLVTAFFNGQMRKNKRGIYSPEGRAVGKV